MMVASPFDVMADTYDRDFTDTSIGRLQRERVWKMFIPVLNMYDRPLNILEINCGTGEDALRLAEMGHDVWATDASGAMIEKAKEKADDKLGGNSSLQFLQSSFADLSLYFKEKSFDIIFSNFGGLNCISKQELKTLSHDLAQLTTHNGRLVFVVMSRYCLWEICYYTLKGDLKRAFRRQRKSTEFKAGENSMPVYYYNPKDLQKIFVPGFQQEKVNPIGLAIPPSYLEHYFAGKPSLLNWMRTWDNGWGNSPLFSGLADHFCITFKKYAE